MTSFAARDLPDDLAAARDALWAARQALDATRRSAARREAGAAAVNACEHALHVALERVRRLEAEADEPEPADAA